MNGQSLYTFATKLMGGYSMDVDLFYQLLNTAKSQREMMRDWMGLRTIDTSITFSSSDTYLSTKTLPERFLRTYQFRDQYGDLRGPAIVNSEGSKIYLKPLKFELRYDYRNSEGYYYIDVKNRSIGRTGSTVGTLHLPFLEASEEITANTAWELPPTDDFDVILAYDVVMEHKGGIDWDTVNAAQIPFNLRKFQQLETNLATWDARLQQAELGL